MSKTTKELNIEEIIKEHHRRKVKLDSHYDPLTGEGSLIERFTCMAVPGVTLYLPVEMKSDELFKLIDQKGYKETSKLLFEEDDKTEDQKLSALDELFHIIRCQYDYEYWCATCVKIENKQAKLVPFVLNKPQCISLADREEMRLNGVPVRQIEGKHRQYGSTTEKNAYAFWIQNIRHRGYRAYICSLQSDAATKIVGRYKIIADNYPSEMGSLRLKPYMGLRNTYQVVGSDSVISIGTAQNPNAPSGDTIQLALISEAGKMKSTSAQGAHKLITNIMSMVPLEEDTFVMVESTAETDGEWFRSQVMKAKKGESGFNLTFISCLTDPQYQIPLEESKYESFIHNMTSYDWDVLWANGANLDQINWYKIKEAEYDQPWEMKQEFPVTIEEMFVGAGKKVFSPGMINTARKNVRQPRHIGEVHGNGIQGPSSLENLSFEDDPKGNLKVWLLPEEADYGKPIARRYACFVDIGGKTKESDYSVIKVLDRAPMLEGGMPECAAEWRGHIDPELLAWKSAQIGMFFDEALLAVEVNALYSRGHNTDGIHYLTIFNEISRHYRNLFTRERPDKLKNKPSQYGYHMTHASKDMLISGLTSAWRSGGEYMERSSVTVDEAAFFEIKEDGTMGAIQGEHDDSLIATAGAKWLATDYMRAPYYIKKPKTGTITRRLGHIADF